MTLHSVSIVFTYCCISGFKRISLPRECMQKEFVLQNEGRRAISAVEIHWHLSSSAVKSFFPPLQPQA